MLASTRWRIAWRIVLRGLLAAGFFAAAVGLIGLASMPVLRDVAPLFVGAAALMVVMGMGLAGALADTLTGGCQDIIDEERARERAALEGKGASK